MAGEGMFGSGAEGGFRSFDAEDQFRAFEAYARRMEDVIAEIHALAEEAREHGIDAAKKAARYRREKAIAFLKATGAVEVRRKTAEAQVAELHEAHLIADSMAQSSRDAMFNKKDELTNLRARMSAFQSVGSMARIETEMQGKLGA